MPDVKTLLARLRNPGPGLRLMGAEMMAASKDAFKAQSYHGVPWERRYPNDGPPPINYAGALNDLNKGQAPKARRFQDRPAGIDIGALRRSITYNQLPNAVESGSPLLYAWRINKGDPQGQDIFVSAAAVTALKKALRAATRARVRNPTSATFHKEVALEKLAFFFTFAEKGEPFIAHTGERPFVGHTPVSFAALLSTFEGWLNR